MEEEIRKTSDGEISQETSRENGLSDKITEGVIRSMIGIAVVCAFLGTGFVLLIIQIFRVFARKQKER